jgi:hypothetical protein
LTITVYPPNIKVKQINHAPSAPSPGALPYIRGRVTMRACRGDGFLTTAESARLVGARPVTIRRWRMLGYLAAQGYDERGYPLHSREAVRAAEKRVRDNGIAASGIDPRRLRKPVLRDAA